MSCIVLQIKSSVVCFFSALSSSSIRVVIATALCLVESMFFCDVEHDVLEANPPLLVVALEGSVVALEGFPPLLVVALEGFGLSQYRYHWLLYVSQEICMDLFATAPLPSCVAAVDEVVLNLVCPHHVLYILSLLSTMSLSVQLVWN